MVKKEKKKSASLCIIENCFKQKSYGDPVNKIKITCRDHAKDTYIDLRKKITCQYLGCKIRPVFGDKDGKPVHCKNHASLGQVDLVNKDKICKYPECTIRASFGVIGKIPTYCSSHAPLNSMEITRKKCEYPDCTILASFGKVDKKPTHCAKHNIFNYKDQVSRKCAYNGCAVRAMYGIPGKTPTHCSKHANSKQKNLRNKKCIHSNCELTASFGESNTKPQYCKTHSLPGHINFREKKCIYEGCKKTRSFGEIGKPKQYCKDHRPEGSVDVRQGKCKHSGCYKRRYYNEDGQKPLYCKDHRLGNHINVIGKKCIEMNCKILALYGKPGYPLEYCSHHKKPGMIRNSTKKPKDEVKECSFCNHVIHYNDEFCKGCQVYIKLGNNTVKFHEKENEIKNLLDDNKIPYTHDKIVVNGCSKKRPDFYIYTSTGKVIILEIDEFQHKRKNYSCECEVTRMKQIFFDIGTQNVLFVRYNPDSYKPIIGKEYTNKQKQNYLIKYLKQTIEESSFGKLGVTYLFYDGFIINQEIEQIDPYDVSPITE